MSDNANWEVKYGRLLRTLALITSIVVAILACGTLILLLNSTGFAFWQSVLKEHFLGTIGLIGIVCAAFGTVTFLRQSEGPIEFEALGMRFKGAAGQVVLWMLCVVTMSLCAKLLW